MWLVSRRDLTPDQSSAVALDTSKHRVLYGGPGSGKTLVLAHRAHALIEERGISPDRLRLLVYTRVLKDYIGEGLDDLGLQEVALGFDAWCGQQLRKSGKPVPKKDGKTDYTEIRRLVGTYLAGLDQPPLDALLVDEGQDLDAAGLAILPLAAKHVTVAMDSRQQLYEHGSTPEQVSAALGVRRAQPTLLTAYRCTPHIVAVAAVFLDDPQEAARFRAANLMEIGYREQPVLFTASDEDAELDELATELQNRAMQGRRSLVLLPKTRLVHRYRNRLESRGLQVGTRNNLSFNDLAPIVLTYHSAKGLTCDAVFLPGVSQRAFAGLPDEQIARMLFVGITRATQWAWIGKPKTGALTMLDRLDPLAGSGDLARMPRPAHTSARVGGAPVPPRKPPVDPLDDLLGILG